MGSNRKKIITDLIEAARKFRFCGRTSPWDSFFCSRKPFKRSLITMGITSDLFPFCSASGSRPSSRASCRSDVWSIFHSPYPHGIRLLKFWGQANIGKILKANRPCEPKDRSASHRSAPPVGCRRVGSPVDHSFTDLHSCRRTVEDQPANLGFEKRD